MFGKGRWHGWWPRVVAFRSGVRGWACVGRRRGEGRRAERPGAPSRPRGPTFGPQWASTLGARLRSGSRDEFSSVSGAFSSSGRRRRPTARAGSLPLTASADGAARGGGLSDPAPSVATGSTFAVVVAANVERVGSRWVTRRVLPAIRGFHVERAAPAADRPRRLPSSSLRRFTSASTRASGGQGSTREGGGTTNRKNTAHRPAPVSHTGGRTVAGA